MRPSVDSIFKSGIFLVVMSGLIALYTCLPTYCSKCVVHSASEQVTANGESGDNQEETPGNPSSGQNTIEVEDDDDSARDFYSLVYEVLPTGWTQIKTSTPNYTPIKGEITTPPPRA